MKSYYEVLDSVSPSEQRLPPIIFMHGMADFRRTWIKVAPRITKKTGRKAYLVDARYHGDSPWEGAMNYEILTQDLLDFMDDQRISKAVIVGHSMGGRTAINFALKHPERVDAIVVEDMTPRDVASNNTNFVVQVLDVLKMLLENLSPDMDLETVKQSLMVSITNFVNGKFMDAEKFQKNYDLDMAPIKKVGNKFGTCFDLDVLCEMLRSNALIQNLQEKGLTFHGDALFIYGSKAFFNLAKDTSVKKLFPKALTIKIEGASHMLHFDSPDAYVDVVSSFILYRNLMNSKY